MLTLPIVTPDELDLLAGFDGLDASDAKPVKSGAAQFVLANPSAAATVLGAAESISSLAVHGDSDGEIPATPTIALTDTALETILQTIPTDTVVSHHHSCACPGCGAHDDTTANFDAPGDDGPVTDGPSGAGAVATLDEMADYLHEGYFGRNVHFNLGDSGTYANSGQLLFNVSGFTGVGGLANDTNGLTEARRELVREAFKIYEEVLGIDFVETTAVNGNVDFYFADNDSGAYAGSYRASSGEIDYSYLNIASGWSGGTSTYDDYTLQTIFHEIGHALGLGHQGDYNGSASYATDATFEYDNWQASMMSYFSQSANDTVNASYEFLQTPMSVDWIALQTKYGSQSSGGQSFGVQNAFQGDTVYGFNTNIAASTSDIWASYAAWAGRTASTIVDGGGNDTIDFSGFSGRTNFDLSVTSGSDLRPATSDVDGRVGNLTLAAGTVIENAIGGSGNDSFVGNSADNVLDGRGGNDSFLDSAGADTYLGGAGSDTVTFSGDFSSYSFSITGSFLRVINVAIDLVENTMENLAFDDQTVTFAAAWAIAAAGTNLGPQARDDSYIVATTTYAADVLANDDDPEDDALTVSALNGSSGQVGTEVTLASGALLTLNTNGTFFYDQNGAFDDLFVGQTILESFDYTITDGTNTDSATVSMTIEGARINTAPTAANDSAVVAEDVILSGLNVLANDTDPENDTMTISRIDGIAVDAGDSVTLASGAQVRLLANGTLRFDQDGAFDALEQGQTDTETFTYTITDGALTDQASVTITIAGRDDNTAPIARNDEAMTTEGDAVSGNVLGNDSDGDGDTLTVTAINGSASAIGGPIQLASGATVQMNANGTYNYDPNGAFNELGLGESDIDSFNYEISDGQGGRDTALVEIEIFGDGAGTVELDFESGLAADGFVFADAVLTTQSRGVSDGASAVQSIDDTLHLTRVDGDSFAFTQAVFTTQERGNFNLTVTGFEDGVSVGSQAVRLRGGQETEIDLNARIFAEVDEVQITASGGIIVDEMIFNI